MLQLFYQPFFIAEMLAFICSLIAWNNKNYPSNLKILAPFLLFVLAVEFSAYYLMELHVKNNHPLYNISMPLSTLFYLHLLGIMIADDRIKKVIIFSMIGFTVFALVNIFLIQGILDFNTYTFIVGGFLIAGFCLVYFVGLLNKKEQVNILKEPAFWIATGLFLYYLSKMIFYISWTYFFWQMKEHPDRYKQFYNQFTLINNILICTLYGFISVNFLCRLHKSK
jgi:hypothetical protein